MENHVARGGVERYKTCHRFGENFFSSIALSICREHSGYCLFVFFEGETERRQHKKIQKISKIQETCIEDSLKKIDMMTYHYYF